RRPVGGDQPARREGYRGPRPPTLSRRRVVKGPLLAGSPIGACGCRSHPGTGREIAELLAALHRPDLPRYWALRFTAALDRTRLHAFLHLLPGLFHFLFVQVHGKTKPV